MTTIDLGTVPFATAWSLANAAIERRQRLEALPLVPETDYRDAVAAETALRQALEMPPADDDATRRWFLSEATAEDVARVFPSNDAYESARWAASAAGRPMAAPIETRTMRQVDTAWEIAKAELDELQAADPEAPVWGGIEQYQAEGR